MDTQTHIQDIIQHILNEKYVLVMVPIELEKSLCFQIPALNVR